MQAQTCFILCRYFGQGGARESEWLFSTQNGASWPRRLAYARVLVDAHSFVSISISPPCRRRLFSSLLLVGCSLHLDSSARPSHAISRVASHKVPHNTMRLFSSACRLTATLAFGSLVSAQKIDPNLVGTWSTKSNKTLTGPVSNNYPPPLVVTLTNTTLTTGLLRSCDRHHDRAVQNRHLLLVHQRWFLRGSLLSRHLQPGQPFVSRRHHAMATWKLCHWQRQLHHNDPHCC
jgi:hypothetical protein